MGGPVLSLDDRGTMDERMLTYTTAPLTEDLQVTGTPVVRLRMSGFELEIIIPRESLDVPAERMWMAKDIAVFGIVRWERDGEVLTLHTQERFS